MHVSEKQFFDLFQTKILILIYSSKMLKNNERFKKISGGFKKSKPQGQFFKLSDLKLITLR